MDEIWRPSWIRPTWIGMAFPYSSVCFSFPRFSFRSRYFSVPFRVNYTLFTSDKGGGKCVCPSSFVCLSVSKITQESACMDLDEMLRVDRCRDMDNWLTFEPDPHYGSDAGTGLLSLRSYALQRGIILRRENPTYRYWAPIAAATRGFKMVLFTANRGNIFVGGHALHRVAFLSKDPLHWHWH